MAPRDLVALIAYVAPDVKATLAARARLHDRTLSQETHRALRQHLADHPMDIRWHTTWGGPEPPGTAG
jgi:hypothetical protein